MSHFDEIFRESGAPVIQQQSGQTVSYRDPKADPVDIIATVGNIETVEELVRDGIVYREERTLVVDTDQDTGIPVIKEAAKVEIDGELWAVHRIPMQSASMTTAVLVRSQTHENSRPNYRGKR